MADAPKRKILEIALAGDRLGAVCDDGSVWQLTDQGWRRLPDIPQDPPAPEAAPTAPAPAAQAQHQENHPRHK